MRSGSYSFLAVVLVLSPAATLAQDSEAKAVRVSDGTLDDMRGGFVSGDGIRVAVNFEGTVMVNGVETAYSALSIRNLDLRRLGDGVEMSWLSEVDGNLPDGLSIQMQHTVDEGIRTVVQNSLDGQVIQYGNTLGVGITGLETNGLQGVRTVLMPALIDALR